LKIAAVANHWIEPLARDRQEIESYHIREERAGMPPSALPAFPEIIAVETRF
jgi:hypothetical protein